MCSGKNRSPEEQARRAKIRELLQESNISSRQALAQAGEGSIKKEDKLSGS